MSKLEDYNEFLVERLRNKKVAEAYLDRALEEFIEDHNRASLLQALHAIASASNSISRLAQRASINWQNLYRALFELCQREGHYQKTRVNLTL